MASHESILKKELANAHTRCSEFSEALDKVKTLLKKADERRKSEPSEKRKWHKVLENLETSLDESKKRVEMANMEVRRLESELERIRKNVDDVVEKTSNDAPSITSSQTDWSSPAHRALRLNLEEASLLQEKFSSGKVHDRQLEASLELANQLGGETNAEAEGQVARRQLALRAAIEKIRQQNVGEMTHEEIKLVLACHALLTSRLEPAARDLRLKGILEGAIGTLQRLNIHFERSD